jgi:putative PIN family toxin of toxin-antitoxin system
MTTVVLDTNVIVSGFVRSRPDSAVVRILDAWRLGQFVLVLSDHILAEVTRTFLDPYFARRLSAGQIEAALRLLQTGADVVSITANVSGVATHPEDDHVLATAVSARADYLVTGDAMLQKLGEYEGVQIVGPRQFLELLSQEDQQA